MNDNSVFKKAITSGIIFGIFLIVTELLIYIFDIRAKSLWANFFILLINIVIYLIGLIFLSKQYRDKELGGFISYGRALGFSTFVCLYASILIMLFTVLLNYVIDPDYSKNTAEKIKEKTIEMMENMNVPQDKIDDALEKFDESMTEEGIKKSKLRGILFTIPVGTFFGFLISLISAAIVKKNKPLFAFENNDNPAQTINQI